MAPKFNLKWSPLPHEPIDKLEEDLWIVRGTLPNMALKRVMTLIRLEDGRVVIHSAIALEEEAMAEIEAWGRPAVLIVPNGFHRLDAPAYLARYPDLEVICPAGSRAKVEEAVPVAKTYEDFDGGARLSIETLEGIRGMEGVLVVRSEAGASLVFNDAIFNMPHGRGVPGFIFRYITGSTGGPRVTRLFKMMALKDKPAFFAHLRRLAETPDLQRIIVSHERVIDAQPAEALKRVAG